MLGGGEEDGIDEAMMSATFKNIWKLERYG